MFESPDAEDGEPEEEEEDRRSVASSSLTSGRKKPALRKQLSPKPPAEKRVSFSGLGVAVHHEGSPPEPSASEKGEEGQGGKGSREQSTNATLMPIVNGDEKKSTTSDRDEKEKSPPKEQHRMPTFQRKLEPSVDVIEGKPPPFFRRKLID